MKYWIPGMLCLLVLACSTRDYENIVIRGSDTEVNLVLRLAEEFMDADPGVSIAVTGGGSGTGIAALINKKTDIANSSRAFKASEEQLAKERGIEVIPIIFAIDALSFVVHPSQTAETLTTQQVRDIYTGKVTNWSEVGGQDLDISLYGRQGNSGTFTFIQKNILQAEYSPDMKQMNGTSQIIEGIKNDPAGIGYVGIGYIVGNDGSIMEGIKVVSIQGDEQTAAVSPTNPENIISGEYTIVRPLYQYLDGKPSGRLLKFLEYELSEAGQAIISENGYFPISARHRDFNQQQMSQ